MVPWRGWQEGECWVPWSGSSLLHNWSCGPRGHSTRRRQPPHLCCAPPQLSRAFISTIDCGSGSGSGYYHSSTPADYCMTGAGHRLLSPSHSTLHTNEMLPLGQVGQVGKLLWSSGKRERTIQRSFILYRMSQNIGPTFVIFSGSRAHTEELFIAIG